MITETVKKNQAKLGWAAQQEPDVLPAALLSLKDAEGRKIILIHCQGVVLLGIAG